MSLGIVLMSKDEIVNDIKNLDKKSQVDVVRSLLNQLSPEVVKEAAEDAAVQVNLGSNNTNGSTVNYSDVVLNFYFGNNTDHLEALATVLDAAAFRLKNNRVVPKD